MSFADERKINCDAVDSFDQPSQIEFNVDTGDLRMRDDTLEWNVLYSKKIACGLKASDPKNCVKKIWHNFDNPQVKNKSATYSVKCKIGNNNLIDQNGELEINRFDDGTGSFVCGRLSKHELALSNCKSNR